MIDKISLLTIITGPTDVMTIIIPDSFMYHSVTILGYHFYQKPSGNYSLLTVPSFYKKGQALSTDFVNLDTILT